MSTGEPTYWPADRSKIPDLLDFYITKDISLDKICIDPNHDMSSDHSPVILTINSEVLYRPSPPRLYNKFTDWNKFREILDSISLANAPLRNSEDIEEATEYLTKCIQHAAWDSTPQTVQSKQSTIPINVREKIGEKRRLRRIWMTTRHPEDRANLNRASRQLQQLLIRYRNESFAQYVQSLTATAATNYSIWRATKKNKRPQIQIPPIRKKDGTWARSATEKIERLAEHFSSVFEPVTPRNNADEEEVLRYNDAPCQLSLPMQSFSTNEVRTTIQRFINPNKSPGYDLITGKVLQELSLTVIEFITSLFNAILRCNHFPGQWKIDQIIAIPKPDKSPNDVASYRPISLLPILSKVSEKILLQRLKPLLQEIIPEHQFGLREHHSTVEQVH